MIDGLYAPPLANPGNATLVEKIARAMPHRSGGRRA